MAPAVTEAGDIQLHGREGLLIPFVFEEDNGSPRDMSEAVVTFEIKGFTKPLTVGDETNHMVLSLNQGELPNTIGKVVDFVVVDYSGSIPHVIWAGKLVQLGWR